MILLYSGGMDSFLYWQLLGQPRCVYVKLGHRYQERELQTIHDLAALATANGDRFAAPHPRYLQGPDLSRFEAADAHIPHRNLTLASCAAQLDSTVVLGFLAGETSPDKSRRFLRHTSRALSTAQGRRVRVLAPLRDYTKPDLLARYLRTDPGELGVNLLRGTRSCWAAGEQPCGSCVPCFRRWVALTLNGLPVDQTTSDPLHFGYDYTDQLAAWKRAQAIPLRERGAHRRKERLARRAIKRATEQRSAEAVFPSWHGGVV